MAEGQRDGQVGVEVHEVPGLVSHPAADHDDGGDDDADEEDEARAGGDDARVALDHAGDLAPQRDPVSERVADRDGTVCASRRSRHAGPATGASGRGGAGRWPVEGGDAAQQQDHDECEVGAEEAGDASGVAKASAVLCTSVRPPAAATAGRRPPSWSRRGPRAPTRRPAPALSCSATRMGRELGRWGRLSATRNRDSGIPHWGILGRRWSPAHTTTTTTTTTITTCRAGAPPSPRSRSAQRCTASPAAPSARCRDGHRHRVRALELATVVISVALAFVFGYAVTSLPLLRAGLALGPWSGSRWRPTR